MPGNRAAVPVWPQPADEVGVVNLRCVRTRRAGTVACMGVEIRFTKWGGRIVFVEMSTFSGGWEV
jgi:hypothetical protein